MNHLGSLLLLSILACPACNRQTSNPVANDHGHDPGTDSSQRRKDAALKVIDGVALHPGRRRDEIASIDHPAFASEEADVPQVFDEDLVVGVSLNGASRAYPIWILGSREIVNDRIGDAPVCVTYCPLSGSAVVFLAQVGGKSLSFGNEGALYECNLVLYDRQTRSLWYQLRGSAIAGAYRKTQLQIIPAVVARWADWRARHPSSTILVGDQQSGRFFRSQNSVTPEPRDSARPMAPVSHLDSRLAPMQRVVGLLYQGRPVCFDTAVFDQRTRDGVSIPGMGTLEVRRDDGILGVFGPDGSEVTMIGAYWFAWHAAYPAGDLITNLSR